MTNEEWAELNRAIERIPTKNPATGRRFPMSHPNQIELERLERLRHFCRHCGHKNPDFYMLQSPTLWAAIAPDDGTEDRFMAGYICLACVAERIPDRRLYREDFKHGAGGVLHITDRKLVSYHIHFPGRTETNRQTVNVEFEFHESSEWSDAEREVAHAALIDVTAWLNDYCRHLGWRLVIDGTE